MNIGKKSIEADSGKSHDIAGNLSNIVGISRSAVAGHIASLVKKGFILGRAYMVKGCRAVTVIGGANLDIKGKLNISKPTVCPCSGSGLMSFPLFILERAGLKWITW
ncbi:MAG: hypothetical protein NUV45_02490 [Tepidanaerobacteraceae bacterium]|nr:hypothetical protein [Tepidanaerobacteraceae bacterium]